MMGRQGKAGVISTAKGMEHSMDNPNVGKVCHWFDASLFINWIEIENKI